jgi:hypothetical protein
MRRKLSLALVLCLAAGAAHGAIPVTDNQRETQEKKISDCMQKARVYKQDSVKPSQGITKSVSTPGSATGTVPQAGTANVTGQGASGSLGTVSGIDYSSLVPAQSGGGQAFATPASLGLDTSAQAILALTNVATGIEANKAGQLIAALAMGSLSLAQGAWDQNGLAPQWRRMESGADDRADDRAALESARRQHVRRREQRREPHDLPARAGLFHQRARASARVTHSERRSLKDTPPCSGKDS